MIAQNTHVFRRSTLLSIRITTSLSERPEPLLITALNYSEYVFYLFNLYMFSETHI